MNEEKLAQEDIKNIKKDFEEIESGEITSFVILGFKQDGSTVSTLRGNGTIIDGLLHIAKLRNDINSKANIKAQLMSELIDSSVDDSDEH